MSPLSSVSPTTPAFNLRLQPDAAVADLSPGMQVLPLDAAKPGGALQPAGDSFGNMLGRMVQEVNGKQLAAADAVSALQSGQNVPLHQVVIAMEEANLSFQLMTEVRNKLLESYQEIMRMQV
jgi:flagellar hook-basal body complex protein FliE